MENLATKLSISDSQRGWSGYFGATGSSWKLSCGDWPGACGPSCRVKSLL